MCQYLITPQRGTIVNKITLNTVSVRGGVNASLIGIQVASTTTNASTTLNIDDNTFTNCGYSIAATTTSIMINATAVVNNLSISRNKFDSLSINSTGNCTLILNNNISTNQTIDGNSIVTSFAKTGTGGIFKCYANTGVAVAGTANIINNNFSNIALTGAATFYGIHTNPTTTAQTVNINNNTITNVTAGSNASFAISQGGGAANSTINNNTIGGISGSGNVTGMLIGDVTAGAGIASCAKNKIYNLSSTGATAVVNGINTLLAGTGVNNFYNNIIGNLSSTGYNSATAPYLGVCGINLSGTATNNLYNNR